MEPTSLSEPTGFRTKADWAYLQLRRWIQSAELSPGVRLDQEDLAARLGVSRVPIRQALVKLEADGLVTSRPHIGATVAPVSLADAEDVYASRRVLESMLADAGALRIEPTTLTDLQDLLDRQRQALSEGDNPRFLELDREFHQTIYQSSGYVRSLELVDRLRDLSDRYVAVFLGSVDRAHVALDEHQRILDALKVANGEAAAQATQEHVARGLEVLREIVASHDDQP